jgi:hypothetical protein
MRNPFKRSEKVNTTNYMNSAREFNPDTETNGATQTWNDKIHPPQSYLIRNKLINEGSAAHRHAQMERNPFFYKLSYGVAQKLFMKKPYPFSYVNPYDVSANGNSQSQNGIESDAQKEGQADSLQRPVKRDNQQPSIKSNAFPLQNPQSVSSPFASPSEPVSQSVEFEVKPEMGYLYNLWIQDNMFEICEHAFAKALGINTAVIIRTKENGQYHFWVFDSSHIRKCYTQNRIIVKIDLEWPSWAFCEEIGQKTVEKAIITYTIGKDCVLFTPLPTVNNPLGKSVLLPVWTAGISKDYLRFLHILYIFKGGVASKYYRIPSNTDASIKTRIETEAKKGLMSEAVTVEYPPGISPEYIDKQFEHEEVIAQQINWDEANTLLSQDSPFPKSYIEGQVESGALGGSAPEMDTQKEENTTFYYFHYLDKLVKMINETFYDVIDQEYLVVPWQDDAATPTASNMDPESPSAPDLKPPIEEEIKKETKRIFGKPNAKFNSITAEGLYEYDAVLLPIESDVPYDDHTENVTVDTIKEYLNDPLSIREGYVNNEHPSNPAEVTKDSAIGKYKITGYDERGMLGKIYFKTKQDPEVGLSNFYYSHDRDENGKIVHANIDFRNVVITKTPRMKGAKAKESQ